MVYYNSYGRIRIAEGQQPKARYSDAMIKKIKGKYVVLSETTGRVFGRYGSKQKAEKRLRQVEFFKYAKQKGIKLKGRRK